MRVRLISSRAFSPAAQNPLYNTRHISPAERKFNDGINFQDMSTTGSHFLVFYLRKYMYTVSYINKFCTALMFSSFMQSCAQTVYEACTVVQYTAVIKMCVCLSHHNEKYFCQQLWLSLQSIQAGASWWIYLVQIFVILFPSQFVRYSKNQTFSCTSTCMKVKRSPFCLLSMSCEMYASCIVFFRIVSNIMHFHKFQLLYSITIKLYKYFNDKWNWNFVIRI